MTRTRYLGLIALVVLVGAGVAYTQGGVNAIASLQGKVNENNELLVNVGTADVNVVNVPSVSVANLVPTSSATYAITPCGIVTTASTNATACGGVPANLYGIYYAVNPTATAAYIRFINSASAPTCTDAVVIPPIPITAQDAAGVFRTLHVPFINPVNFSAGVGVCVTGASDGTTNAPAGIQILLAIKG